MEKVESFEITEYGSEHEIPGRTQGVITEIVQEMNRSTPSCGVRVTFTGNMMKLTYHAYEMHLPVRLKMIEHNAKSSLDEAVKLIKKQFKERTGNTISPKERKEFANTSAQKVSLNERYMYSSWRFYELK